MKKIVILLTIVLTLCSCAKKENITPQKAEEIKVLTMSEIAGSYYAVSCKNKDGEELNLNNEILHLNEDGSGIFFFDGDPYELVWTFKDGKILFEDSEGDNFEGTYTAGMIYGTYFDDITYIFTNDYALAMQMQGIQDEMPNSTPNITSSPNEGTYFYKATLYEPIYGIKTANTLVPYGWTASVSVEWGLMSTMYPAAATVKLVSPDGNAKIEIRSASGFMQMARNGIWVKEGTYLDFYNTLLNYKTAGQFNDYMLGLMNLKGTVMDRESPSWEYQLALNGQANIYLEALSSPSGSSPLSCEATSEKTTYFITQGEPYEVQLVSTVLMAHVQIMSNQEQYQWLVPQASMFTAYTEEAFSQYKDVFDFVVGNTSFCENFLYVVQKNAAYLNEMMHNYLMEKVYNPTGADINSWNSTYVDSGNDKFINDWCDVIKEVDTYNTSDGDQIKVSTQYDAVYQNGDYIFAGPQGDYGVDWTQLNKAE